ncbi:MAG: hypothetical protein PHG13_01235 [Candidatus Pacebacteria bacterium]|nr:hypothetical protein [Candidatus Paceibacterota bacterium]MDD5721920.1 hypothetical protein [Candidatus Paceibacterota bacterium]
MKKEEFLKKFDVLPKSLQEALYSDKVISIIQDAGSLAGLNEEELFILNEIVTDVLLLNISSDDFALKLKSHLKIKDSSLKIINQIIQDKIFDQYKKDLLQFKSRPTISQEKPPIQFKTPALGSFEKKPKKELSEKNQITEIDIQSIAEKIKPEALKEPLDKFTMPQSKTIKPQTEKPQARIPESEIIKPEPIPEYIAPEPTEVKVTKPINKIEELKKVTVPETTLIKQEKIRNKLLEAITKKDAQPKIVEEIKKVLKSKKEDKEAVEEKPLERKKVPETEPSTVLTGRGEEFTSEKPIQKSPDKKPYVLDVKLQEMKKRSKEKEFDPKPVQYEKYKKESPFGKTS